MSDITRASASAVSYLLSGFPCVVVLGARQIGKTTLLRQILPNASYYDLERLHDWERFHQDPEFALRRAPEPVVVDEAQRLPEIFPALRVLIDSERRKNGRFLLSGSSSPELMRKVTESLAGRVAIFELSGFSLQESWGVAPSGFCAAVEENRPEALLELKSRLTVEALLESCLDGSYPEPVVRRQDRRFVSLWMENYFRTYIERDVRSLFPDLRLPTYRRFISMLGHASGQIINASEFARSLDVSQPTVKSYLNIAEGTFLWRNLPSFNRNIQRRVSKMPKGHLRDTGLLNHLAGIFTTDALLGNPLAGRIWEAFLIEEIIKGFQNRLGTARFYYYRTHNGAEIDLIVETASGVVPIDIKLGTAVTARSVRALSEFVQEGHSRYGIVINNADRAGWVKEGIVQVPAGCL